MIFLGADHRGYWLKEKVKEWLESWGEKYEDKGAYSLQPDDDFVDFGLRVAEAVAEEEGRRGIVICGSGTGMVIVVNKVAGVRGTVGVSEEQVRESRRTDDVNVLALAADYTGEEEAKRMVKAFLETEFKGEEKYKRRLSKIKKWEEESFS